MEPIAASVLGVSTSLRASLKNANKRLVLAIHGLCPTRRSLTTIGSDMGFVEACLRTWLPLGPSLSKLGNLLQSNLSSGRDRTVW